MIDLPRRRLLGKIKTPQPIAGIAVSDDGKTVVAVSDSEPVLFAIDPQSGEALRTIPLRNVPKPAQIVRYSPDASLICVTSLNSDCVTVMKSDFRQQSTITIGGQPMDMGFRGDLLFVGCQGDGTVHVVDLASRKAVTSFSAGKGCESIGVY